jgi:hypothetical protein
VLAKNINTTEPTEIPLAKQTMAVEDSTGHIGSASWIGADAYELGGEFHAGATMFLETVKWDALESIASRLRNGAPCNFSEKYSIGHFILVRRISFADGISWVARLRLPQLKTVFGDCEVLDVASTLKVEIASMKFLKDVASG